VHACTTGEAWGALLPMPMLLLLLLLLLLISIAVSVIANVALLPLESVTSTNCGTGKM